MRAKKAKPRRLVQVECATPSSYRWLLRQMLEYPQYMGDIRPDGWLLLADETRFLEALSAAQGSILESKLLNEHPV